MEPENSKPTSPATEPRPPRPEKPSFTSWVVAVLLAAAVSAFAAYVWMPNILAKASQGIKQAARKAKEEYYCPMHPQQRSDKPGNCPICSMKLVKLEKTPEAAMPSSDPSAKPMPGMPMQSEGAQNAPSIFIAPERQQLIGVKTVAAAMKPLVKEIRTVGKVAFDETKTTHIHTKVSGFIEDVFVDFVGKPVERGSPLFTIYSPDLVATQEEYLLALKSKSTLQDSAFPWISNGARNLLRATRRRLRLWDVTDQEINELEQSGEAKHALTFYSPVSGIVTERAAYHHGKYVTPEMDLYTIVDLSTVWLLGEVYEYELPNVALGETVQVELPYAGESRVRAGKVVFISPMLDPKTRTAQVRLEFDNSDLTLRPDMFVNFKIRRPLGDQLVVPEEAVLDTGTEQYVFVDKGQGYFEPRTVKLGAEAGGFHAIEHGLRAGERVVTSANFILDSESRLKGAFANMGAPSAEQMTRQAPASSPGLRVEIEQPKQAKVGKNQLRLSLKDASGAPIDQAEVEVTLFMPQMGSMAPMRSKASLGPAGQGQYAGEIDIPMAWTWETTVTAKKEGKTLGTARTSITAR